MVGSISLLLSSISLVLGSISLPLGSASLVLSSVSFVLGSISLVFGSISIMLGSINLTLDKGYYLLLPNKPSALNVNGELLTLTNQSSTLCIEWIPSSKQFSRLITSIHGRGFLSTSVTEMVTWWT